MNADPNRLSDMRVDYTRSQLNEDMMHENPIVQFKSWFKEALEFPVPEPNIMILSTAGSDGIPHARVVLLKDISDAGFTFYTNYESQKGREIAQNNRVSLLFMWTEMQRQVRIEGLAERLSEQEAIEYFNTRPLESQVGATVSQQSEIIPNRDHLDQAFNKAMMDYKTGDIISKPPYWGGYLVKPVLFEYWQGRANRLHDRLLYKMNEQNNWTISRLSP